MTRAAVSAETADGPTAGAAGLAESARAVLIGQVVVGVLFLGVWEVAGRQFGHDWTSLPSLIAVRLATWLIGDLWLHALTTATEMLVGLALGGSAGVVVGLVLGRSPVIATVLRPIIVALYSVPLITMAPLLILWFGLDLEPKIVLVTIVVFFLVFFNTFAGVAAIDGDLIASFQLLGGNRREEFQKVVAPASMVWILSGLKIALPYALAAATTGELLAARRGLGSLLAQAAHQFDMTGVYAALLVLMAMGILVSEVANRLERRLLRWRRAAA
ncbi:MAG: ABC transporter permease [Proteobacteria bacterium]|nr:ABC transporter permease [Pseudomonadota bacterium]